MTRPFVAHCLLLAAATLVGCDKQAPTPSPNASASAASISASVAKPVASVPEKKRPWFAGDWSGTYDAQHYLIETPKNEGAREWATDDGGTHSGEGQLSLRVDDAGVISGWARGPLGEQTVSGEVDGETFSVRLAPKTPGERAFGGILVLRRKGDALSGRLQASSGDSRTVRDALVEVHRGAASGAGSTAVHGTASAGAAPSASAPSAAAPGGSAPRSAE